MHESRLRRLVLVTGASGALGPVVVNWLGERGYRVRALARVEPSKSVYTVPVEWFRADICDQKLVEEASYGVDSIVHMAALLHVNQPGKELEAEYERVNVGGTQIVLEAAARNDVRRVIFLSTIAVYGRGRCKLLTEDSQPQPDSLYSITKLAAERLVQGASASDGLPRGVILRLGAVYGSRVKGNYFRLVKALAQGRFVPVGRGDNRRTLVQEKDVARAVSLALDSRAALGQVYNVTDGDVHALHKIIATICAALGRPIPKLALPELPVRATARVGDALACVLGRPLPIGSALVEKYLEDMAVDGRRIIRELGFHPAFDLYSGWKDAIAGMRANGVLPE